MVQRAKFEAKSWTAMLIWMVAAWSVGAWGSVAAWGAEQPDYENEIAPLLTQYCGGCHTEGEANAELSLDGWKSLMHGSENGAVVTPGSAESSRLIQVMLGTVEPKMPPEGEAAPTDDEIRQIRQWIDAGAHGPDGDQPQRAMLRTPSLPKSGRADPITALAMSPDGKYVAAGSFQTVRLIRVGDRSVVRTWDQLPGKVESVSFSPDGMWLAAGTGVAGLRGEAVVWQVDDGAEVLRVGGHRDSVYAAVLSHDCGLLATASYDRKILLWDTASGDAPRTEITEHNGPVYDLAFSPDGANLISASDDATVKVWRIRDGQRMDTRSEPLRGQYTVAMHPQRQIFVGGGADSRIRVWQFISRNEPAINPILHARLAHEEAILALRFSEDGKWLLSLGKDGSAKLWETQGFEQVHVWPPAPGGLLTAAISSTAGVVVLGGTDARLMWHELPKTSQSEAALDQVAPPEPVSAPTLGTAPHVYDEQEPNHTPQQAQSVEVPAEITGVIAAPHDGADRDVDLVRFTSKAGQPWVIEVRASQNQSPLDSHVEVLTDSGERIERVRLQAIRDSYFNFRGLDSFQTGDFRLHNWEEMGLNQLLYCNGEVVKFYHYPRGPDSGFNVYPNFGHRHALFDTTPTTHAFLEPCYVVEPLAPGEPPVPNGLPVFTLYYENDDDSLRRAGTDSRLTFTAPHDGQFLVRLSDVRGQGGDDYRYRLSVRAPRPDFEVRLDANGKNPTVGPGRGRKFSVQIDRIDGFTGPVRLDIEGLPEGVYTASPVTIESGHLRAWGTLWVPPGSDKPESLESEIRIVASAEIGGVHVQKEPISLGQVKWDDSVKLQAELLPNHNGDSTSGTAANGPLSKDGLPVIEVVPGTTTTARVRIQRHGEQGPVSFGKEDAAVNAPHGVYVSNIGLNGVLIPEGEQERTIFLDTEPWVEPVERVIFLQAEQAGNATTNPVWLRVVDSPSGSRDVDQ